METDVWEQIKDMLPWLVPLAILQLAIMVVALVDLVKREKVRGDSKVVWALLIIFINLIGPIVYLIAGRGEDSPEGED
jgi:hypothetical protein